MIAQDPTPCPMPNIETTSLDPDIYITTANYYDGWYLRHIFSQMNGYNCTHINLYKNNNYELDMPHYNNHVLDEERPNNEEAFNLSIILQAPLYYDAGATACECPTPSSNANALVLNLTGVFIYDIYDYYNLGNGIGFNETFTHFHLLFAGCMLSNHTNENVLPH